jgi:hypothetical protein
MNNNQPSRFLNLDLNDQENVNIDGDVIGPNDEEQ